MNVNLDAAAGRALDLLMVDGGGVTDEIRAAVRLAAVVRPLVDDHGAVTVLGPDGARTRVVVL